jgi:hypothetical protein
MNVDHLNSVEKKVYWKTFFEQRLIINKFREDMILFNPEWNIIDSQGLEDAVKQVFNGNYEADAAKKAVENYRSEQLAIDLQIAFDLQCQFEDETF